MRMVSWILVGACLLWSGYWYGAGYLIRQSIETWFEAQRARGWQAEAASLDTTGFPLRHVTTLTAPALADPGTGVAWRAEWLDLISPAVWPGRQQLVFAPAPQRLSYFDQTALIEAHGLMADLHLAPGLALRLERMALDGGPWLISGPLGPMLAGAGVTLIMAEEGAPETYRIEAALPDFAPGPDLRARMGTSGRLPERFETLEVSLVATFDRPWDRRALEDRRPQPVALDLTRAEARWGALRVQAVGEVTIDSDGVPTGKVALQAENWREMLAMAQAAGVIGPQMQRPAEQLLTFLSGLGGSPDAIDVQLNLRDGFWALGPVPIGPAPRIILR